MLLPAGPAVTGCDSVDCAQAEFESMRRIPVKRFAFYAVPFVFAAVLTAPLNLVHAQVTVPKQVHLIVDGSRLTASNVRFSRFDELKLAARERLEDSEEGEGVIVAVTNQRIIAYGVVSGWRSIDRVPNERVESLSAEDFAGLVVTNQRLLNFNGESGVWGEHDRAIAR